MISSDYSKIINASRENNPYWGSGGTRHAEPVVSLLMKLGVNTGTILDYGSGVGTFGNTVRQLYGKRYFVVNYDPSRPQWAVLPDGPFDAVVSTHVLEHIEPELIDGTLVEIRERAKKLVFLEIPHREAKETLTDGRNAHLIIEPHEWWYEKIKTWFADAKDIQFKPSTLKTQTQYTIYV